MPEVTVSCAPGVVVTVARCRIGRISFVSEGSAPDEDGARSATNVCVRLCANREVGEGICDGTRADRREGPVAGETKMCARDPGGGGICEMLCRLSYADRSPGGIRTRDPFVREVTATCAPGALETIAAGNVGRKRIPAKRARDLFGSRGVGHRGDPFQDVKPEVPVARAPGAAAAGFRRRRGAADSHVQRGVCPRSRSATEHAALPLSYQAAKPGRDSNPQPAD
jgi:hypothetical protein